MAREQSASASRCRTTARFVDAHGRVRALLRRDLQTPILTFLDETGRIRNTLTGLVPVSEALFRMLNEPDYHPEIVGRRPPLSPQELRGLPPAVLRATAGSILSATVGSGRPGVRRIERRRAIGRARLK